MTDFDDLDDLLGPLRAPATAAELAAENDVVGLMAAAHHSSKGNTMFTSRRARVATLVAAGIIGFGGVAAAGPKVLDNHQKSPAVQVDDQDEQDQVEQDQDEQDQVEQEVEEELDDDAVDDKVEEIDEVEEKTVAAVEEIEEVKVADEPADVAEVEPAYCIPEGNHGKTVSAVARGLPVGDGTIRYGDADYPSVTEAAHSSCGKTVRPDEIDEDIDEVEEVEVDDVETDDVETDDVEIEDVDDVDDVEKADASPKQHGRPDKPGKPEHAGKGRSDK